MKAFVITIPTRSSLASAEKLRSSSARVKNPFRVALYKGATPLDVEWSMKARDIKWTYPWEGEVEGPEGMTLKAYKTSSRLARMACFMSHYMLWEGCAARKEPVLILEDDALFTRAVDESVFDGWGAVSLNDPRGATRCAGVYHRALSDSDGPVAPCPTVDGLTYPEGLPGHSAYVIQPWAAEEMLELVRKYGAWPNDAIMCKQLVGWLGCLTDYRTTVQKRPSNLAR